MAPPLRALKCMYSSSGGQGRRRERDEDHPRSFSEHQEPAVLGLGWGVGMVGEGSTSLLHPSVPWRPVPWAGLLKQQP